MAGHELVQHFVGAEAVFPGGVDVAADIELVLGGVVAGQAARDLPCLQQPDAEFVKRRRNYGDDLVYVYAWTASCFGCLLGGLTRGRRIRSWRPLRVVRRSARRICLSWRTGLPIWPRRWHMRTPWLSSGLRRDCHSDYAGTGGRRWGMAGRSSAAFPDLPWQSRGWRACLPRCLPTLSSRHGRLKGAVRPGDPLVGPRTGGRRHDSRDERVRDRRVAAAGIRRHREVSPLLGDALITGSGVDAGPAVSGKRSAAPGWCGGWILEGGQWSRPACPRGEKPRLARIKVGACRVRMNRF